MLPNAHVEEAATERDDYERKSGCVISSYDTTEIRQVRFGNLRETQEKILKEADTQNDRQIHFFYDPSGAHGKTFCTLHLWERREAFVVPRSDATAGKLSAFVCSGYSREKYIIIDLPRSSIASRELYECLEDTKDGLVFDHRYSARTRNIRGAKLIVFTNSPINPDALSWDRYRLFMWNKTHEDWDSISINQMREMYEYTQKKKKSKTEKKAKTEHDR